jgi:hypothetical protein
MPALLFVTGLITWWRRAKKKSRVEGRNETAAESMALAGQ